MSDESQIPASEEGNLLAAEYVLGTLTPDEHTAVGERLRAETTLQADVRFWRRRLAGLNAQFAETTAPLSVWPAIERRLFPEEVKASFWNSLAVWRGLTAALAAVAVIAVGINVATPRPDPSAFAAQVVAALSKEGSGVSMVALYNTATGQIRLTTLSGQSVPEKDYELWAIEGSNAPKSMGLLDVSSRNDMTLTPEQMVGFGAGTTLAISLEPKGGSPTGQPTGPVVASGMATAI